MHNKELASKDHEICQLLVWRDRSREEKQNFKNI